MLIAVLSDIHDHLDKLEKAVVLLSDAKCKAVIFCGDLVSPFITGVLAKTSLPTYAVLGNNDEDHIGMMKKGGPNFTWFHLSQEFGEADLGGKKIAFCHYPKLGELLAGTGKYDAVFFGHTHEALVRNVGNTLLINPGAICGINFATGKYDKAAFVIYDTDKNSVQEIKV